MQIVPGFITSLGISQPTIVVIRKLEELLFHVVFGRQQQVQLFCHKARFDRWTEFSQRDCDFNGNSRVKKGEVTMLSYLSASCDSKFSHP